MEAEKDLVRRSSGKKEVTLAGLGGGGLVKIEPEGLEEEEEKMDLRVAAAEEEEVEGRREKEEGLLEEEEWSRMVRRSQRQEGQKPVNCSSG